MIKVLISAILVVVSYTQPPSADLGYCKLKWEYFSLRESKDNTVAETVTGIGYKYDGESNVEVFCSFDKSESYVSKKGKTDYILNHEQRHFDITYIYTKKLIAQIKAQSVLSDEIIGSLYDKIVEEKDNFQSLYDSETRHSEDKLKQDLWDKKIDKLLK